MLVVAVLAACTLFKSCAVALNSGEKQALESISLDWYWANKLIAPPVAIRMDRVECAAKQINCLARPELEYSKLTYRHGFGSAVLKLVNAFLVEASAGKMAARGVLAEWRYGSACTDEQTSPFECYFKPICPHDDSTVHVSKQFMGLGQTGVRKKLEVLANRCDGATYEELTAGMMQHLKFNFEPKTFSILGPTVVEDVLKLRQTPYAAIHIRVSKTWNEYMDQREHILVRIPKFWSELLRHLYKAGWRTVYLATDKCSFLPKLNIPTGMMTISSCNYTSALNLGDEREHGDHTEANWAALKMDMWHLAESTHFYADMNSNMDIIIARMRAFQNVTLAVGPLKSIFNEAYGDERPIEPSSRDLP
jgi:hypothetical protein